MINFTAFTIDSRRLVGPQRAIRRSLKKKKMKSSRCLLPAFTCLWWEGKKWACWWDHPEMCWSSRPMVCAVDCRVQVVTTKGSQIWVFLQHLCSKNYSLLKFKRLLTSLVMVVEVVECRNDESQDFANSHTAKRVTKDPVMGHYRQWKSHHLNIRYDSG